MHKRPRHIQYIIRAAVILLLIVFANQVFNRAVYLHTHMLDSGRLVTHAHPFNRGVDTEPVKSHQHTQEQVVFLDNLQFLFPVFFAFLCLLALAGEKRFFDNISSSHKALCLSAHHGRAPPVL